MNKNEANSHGQVRKEGRVWIKRDKTTRQGTAGQKYPSLLVVLLLSAAHALIPASLSNARLIVRRNRLDVLHDALNGGSRFVAVAVQGSLQKDSPTSKDSALEPCHSVPKVVEPNLLASDRLPHSGDGNLALGLAHGNLDHLLTSSVSSAATGLATFSLLDTVVVLIIGKEARAGRAWRGALHLSGEIATGEDAGSLAEAVRDLVGVDALKGHPDTEARSADIIFDKNKLALLGLRDVREEIVGLISVTTAVALSRDSTASVGSHVRHWRASGIWLVVVSSKNVSWSHVVVVGRVLTRRSLVVMVFVGVTIADFIPSTLSCAVGVSSCLVVVHRLTHAAEARLAHGRARSHGSWAARHP